MVASTSRGAFGVVSEEPVAPQVAAPAPAPVIPEPPKAMTGLKSLKRMVMKPAPEPVPVEAPKGEFVAGKRPEPTGPRAHELWSDPEVRAQIAEMLDEVHAAKPGRQGKIKAPEFIAAWNAKNPDRPLNGPRARTILARAHKAREDYLQSQVANYMAKGSKKAVT